jgi:hypothetical protein
MFRRFLIVCWSLFVVSVIVLGVEWLTYRYAQVEVQDIATQHYDSAEAFSSHLCYQDESRCPGVKGKIARLRSQYFAAKENAENHLSYFYRISAVAIFLLTWNIIWHIGLWIWMGRKGS